MNIKLSVIASSPAVSDVKLVELVEQLSKENIQVRPNEFLDNEDMISRMGNIEAFVLILTSSAATQLALALRDHVKKQSVEILCTSPDGSCIKISAEGGDPQSTSDIVGFLTKQYEKRKTDSPVLYESECEIIEGSTEFPENQGQIGGDI
jgi:hypothetical protein